MNRIFSILSCLLCLSLLATASSSFADYYKYTDSSGAVNLTNKLDSVPAKYRSSMKVIKEERKKDVAPQPQAAEPASAPAPEAAEKAAAPAAAEPRSGGTFEELSARFPWFSPLVYMVAITAIFVCLAKLTTYLPARWMGKVVYVAFSLGLFAFLYKTYTDSVVRNSQKLMEDAKSVVEKSNARQSQLPVDESAPHGQTAAVPAGAQR